MIFALIRFFVLAAIIYFILTIVRGVLRAWIGRTPSSSPLRRSKSPEKKKEEYKDVREASFTELTDTHEEKKTPDE